MLLCMVPYIVIHNSIFMYIIQQCVYEYKHLIQQCVRVCARVRTHALQALLLKASRSNDNPGGMSN